MKIIFFGNTDFGIPTLDILKDKRLNTLAIVTNKDKNLSRKKRLAETPIKKWAIANKAELIQQDALKDKSFIARLSNFNADFFVVIAYKLLPYEIFSLPKFGTINLHASLLPLYRGAAPIQRAILNGDKETGVSTFIIDKDIDTGRLIMQKKILLENQSYGEMHKKLSIIGAQLMSDSINHIINKKPLISQKGKVTYAHKINKSEFQINWNKNSTDILNLIRAFSPSPGAYTYLNNKRVRITAAVKTHLESVSLSAGLIYLKNKCIYIGTKTDPIEVKELQPEGKKNMNALSFFNGYVKDSGEMFESKNR